MAKDNRTVVELGDYRTLPLQFAYGRVIDGIPAFGSGQFRFIYKDPDYKVSEFEYSRECLLEASKDASYAARVLRHWGQHVADLGYYLQFHDDRSGDRFKRLHSHTELASAIISSRLDLDESSLWHTFEYLLQFKFVQEAYRADQNREGNYEKHCDALERLSGSDSSLPARRLIERAIHQVEIQGEAWSTLKPIHISPSKGTDSLIKASLFYSYSHADEKFRNELEKHLSILQRNRFIDQWHDRRIAGGEEWKQQIDEHLKSAQIILLLISSDFLASDYCYDLEMEQALRQHEQGISKVIPIFLRPCDWEGGPFGKLQGYPTDAKAVTLWANQDEAFTNIAKGIRAAVNDILKKPG